MKKIVKGGGGKRRKVLIWGCGVTYNKISALIKYLDLDVQALISKDKEDFILDNYRIISPEDIPDYEYDYIIVANNAFDEIRLYVDTSEKLKEGGCTVDRLIPYHVFFNPGFDLEKYLQFKESRPSILANNCIGGFLYKQWGLPFLSPTINMYALGENYLEFLDNYPYYLSKPMERYENDDYIKGTGGRESYTPKGIIDNKIIWYLNHDILPEFSIQTWNERRLRVNERNIIAIMTIFTDEEAYAFETLKIKKKIGFYHRNLGLESVVYLKEWENLKYRNKYQYAFGMMVNALAYQQDMCDIDWLSFFCGDEYLRKKYIN